VTTPQTPSRFHHALKAPGSPVPPAVPRGWARVRAGWSRPRQLMWLVREPGGSLELRVGRMRFRFGLTGPSAATPRGMGHDPTWNRVPADPDRLPDVARPPSLEPLVNTAPRRNRRAAASGAVAVVLAVILVVGAGACTGPSRGPAGTDDTGSVTGPVTDAVITLRFRVGRDPSDLAVHPVTGDVYVSNTADDTVSIIDETAHRVTDTVDVGHEPYDITIDPTTGLVYVSNGGGEEDADQDKWTGSVSVIDAETRRVVHTIVFPRGKWPGGSAVDPSTHSLFVTNSDATVSVIDTDTNKVVATVEVGRSPGSVVVSPAANEAYVVNLNGGTVSVIDTRTYEVVHTIEGSGGDIAVDPPAGLLFLCNEGDGTVTVLDAKTREPVKVIRVGGRGPFSVELDAEAERAYVTGAQDQTIAVIDTDSLEVVERIAVPAPGAVFENPVVHAATDRVYLFIGRRDVGVIARR
jgi:YVTN family beta-propeller protein